MTIPLHEFQFTKNQSSEIDVVNHLTSCNDSFNPPLSTYVNIEKYSKKLYSLSNRRECWSGLVLVGLVAFYVNESEKRGFVTNVSVLKEFQGLQIARMLLLSTLEDVKEVGIRFLDLEVYANNTKAIQLYKKLDFEVLENKEKTLVMRKTLVSDAK